MSKEKKIYYSDLTTLIDVCYSCSSQNIIISNHNDNGRKPFCNDGGRKPFCKDCGSEDIGAEFPKDLI